MFPPLTLKVMFVGVVGMPPVTTLKMPLVGLNFQDSPLPGAGEMLEKFPLKVVAGKT